MDKNSDKILKFFNAHSKDNFSISEVARCFPNISTNDLKEILESLRKDGYLRLLGNSYQSTNKSKTYKSVNRNNWLSEHFIDILALVVSFIALIESTIALVISILK